MHYFWDRLAQREKGRRESEKEEKTPACINLMVYKINWRLIFNKTDSNVK